MLRDEFCPNLVFNIFEISVQNKLITEISPNWKNAESYMFKSNGQNVKWKVQSTKLVSGEKTVSYNCYPDRETKNAKKVT